MEASMRRVAAALALVGASAVSLGAQGSGWPQRIPPGQMPPPGQCRVWYDGVPPGQQPRVMSCRDAESIAARNRNARVIYGDDPYWGGRGRSTPRRSPYPNRGSYPGRYYYGQAAFDQGYRDGYDKGREDADDRDRYEPERHGRYRSADHGYERRYGPKDQYKAVYRDGFLSGYSDGYRTYGRYGSDRSRDGVWLPWPF
jgi:hypothetical protein